MRGRSERSRVSGRSAASRSGRRGGAAALRPPGGRRGAGAGSARLRDGTSPVSSPVTTGRSSSVSAVVTSGPRPSGRRRRASSARRLGLGVGLGRRLHDAPRRALGLGLRRGSSGSSSTVSLRHGRSGSRRPAAALRRRRARAVGLGLGLGLGASGSARRAVRLGRDRRRGVRSRPRASGSARPLASAPRPAAQRRRLVDDRDRAHRRLGGGRDGGPPNVSEPSAEPLSAARSASIASIAPLSAPRRRAASARTVSLALAKRSGARICVLRR